MPSSCQHQPTLAHHEDAPRHLRSLISRGGGGITSRILTAGGHHYYSLPKPDIIPTTARSTRCATVTPPCKRPHPSVPADLRTTRIPPVTARESQRRGTVAVTTDDRLSSPTDTSVMSQSAPDVELAVKRRFPRIAQCTHEHARPDDNLADALYDCRAVPTKKQSGDKTRRTPAGTTQRSSEDIRRPADGPARLLFGTTTTSGNEPESRQRPTSQKYETPRSPLASAQQQQKPTIMGPSPRHSVRSAHAIHTTTSSTAAVGTARVPTYGTFTERSVGPAPSGRYLDRDGRAYAAAARYHPTTPRFPTLIQQRSRCDNDEQEQHIQSEVEEVVSPRQRVMSSPRLAETRHERRSLVQSTLTPTIERCPTDTASVVPNNNNMSTVIGTKQPASDGRPSLLPAATSSHRGLHQSSTDVKKNRASVPSVLGQTSKSQKQLPPGSTSATTHHHRRRDTEHGGVPKAAWRLTGGSTTDHHRRSSFRAIDSEAAGGTTSAAAALLKAAAESVRRGLTSLAGAATSDHTRRREKGVVRDGDRKKACVPAPASADVLPATHRHDKQRRSENAAAAPQQVNPTGARRSSGAKKNETPRISRDLARIRTEPAAQTPSRTTTRPQQPTAAAGPRPPTGPLQDRRTRNKTPPPAPQRPRPPAELARVRTEPASPPSLPSTLLTAHGDMHHASDLSADDAMAADEEDDGSEASTLTKAASKILPHAERRGPWAPVSTSDEGKPFCPKKACTPPALIGCTLRPADWPRLRYRLRTILQNAIYGAVYYASEEAELSPGRWYRGRPVAIKMMVRHLVATHKGETQEDMTAEIRFRDAMHGHPNVLTHDLHWEDRGAVFLVMPFAELGDLFDAMLRRPIPLSESEARWLFARLLDGAVFLHERGVAFRDHSLENVLLFRDHPGSDAADTLIPRITDPGQAIQIEYDAMNQPKKVKATKLFGKSFRPPEAYLARHYDPAKVDVFCLGWMLFFTLTKRQAFHRALLSDATWALLVGRRYSDFLKKSRASFLSSSVCSLLWKMLDPDPVSRISAHACRAHVWFQEGPQTPLTITSFGSVPKPEAPPASAPPAKTLGHKPALEPTLLLSDSVTATTACRLDMYQPSTAVKIPLTAGCLGKPSTVMTESSLSSFAPDTVLRPKTKNDPHCVSKIASSSYTVTPALGTTMMARMKVHRASLHAAPYLTNRAPTSQSRDSDDFLVGRPRPIFFHHRPFEENHHCLNRRMTLGPYHATMS